MAEGQTYNIPETQLDWFREKLAKLSKRAVKLVGEKVYCTVVGYHFLDGEGPKKLQKTKFFEVFVSHPDVKLNGWQFIARIDHSQEAGSVVRVVPGMSLPEHYRVTGPVCEHCRENRARRDTFVLNCVGTDEFKQVGSSCLKDFTGHNGAQKYAEIAEMLAIIGDYARGIGFNRQGQLNDYRWVNSRYFMALAAESVLDRGWISAAAAKADDRLKSTRASATDMMFSSIEPSTPAFELADRAIEWAQVFGNDGKELNDWEHNCRIVTQSDALETRHLGIAASVVGVFWNKFVRQNQQPKISDYVGKVGDRYTSEVKIKAIIAGENSVRHIFEDDDGNTIIWFGSSDLGRDKVGSKVTISMRIKNHQIYANKKQTLVSHVKVVQIHEA